ncbi:MAG: lipoprotein-releasing ABC transporter permease subunit [Gammaproteobacteria bacterium]|nr:MAG: lipoprotein-releasing ABC transporter permease subunit [Gammaproteobacteria bacterium]
MMKNIPLYIGLRYTRAKRRNQFISFISAFSLIGMALGVMSLIVVLSVMNGLDREMKQRLLSVIPHGYITRDPSLSNWQEVAEQVKQHPKVLGAAPFIASEALLTYSDGVQGIQLEGILPEEETKISVIDKHMLVGTLEDLRPGEFGVVMGSMMARQLGLALGDKVVITSPDINITPAGVYLRKKSFTLVGVFEVGAQVDLELAIIHLADAQKFFRVQGAQGLHVKVNDLYQAGNVMSDLAAKFGSDYKVKDWSQTQGSLFQSVKMEKIVTGTLLNILIFIAVFNIVSSLVLMVADKRSDIAVLRTLGLTAKQVMGIFIVQGSAVGFVGTLIGVIAGCILTLLLNPIMGLLETLFGFHFFDPETFYISGLPNQLMWQDLVTITLTALILSFLATLYPAYRASKIEPAEALRYE